MITPTLFRTEHKLRIEYPKGSRMRTEVFAVHNVLQVQQVLHRRMKEYLVVKVYGYAKQRQHALSATMSIQQMYGLSRIHEAFSQHQECSLRGIAVRVAKVGLDLEILAPAEKSRYYRRTEERRVGK